MLMMLKVVWNKKFGARVKENVKSLVFIRIQKYIYDLIKTIRKRIWSNGILHQLNNFLYDKFSTSKPRETYQLLENLVHHNVFVAVNSKLDTCTPLRSKNFDNK